MLPFTISLQRGLPIYEQVVYAVTKAVVNGQLRSGDAFPSVRVLSQELKINPNTAHKIVLALIEKHLLVVRPGIGTVVAEDRPLPAQERRSIVEEDTERLVIEAKHAGVSLDDLVTAVRRHWTQAASAARAVKSRVRSG
jgi:GntR family transcriptional regulator